MQSPTTILTRRALVLRLVALFLAFAAIDGISAGVAPAKILLEADRFAWLGNWQKARPLYKVAEEEANAKSDGRNALAASIGTIHSRIWSTSSADLIELLDGVFKNPAIYQDPDLKLRWFLAKAQLTEQLDLSESRRCWSEVLQLAKQTNSKGWERRASGQLGVLRWLIDVDSAASTREVGLALIEVINSRDRSAEAYFLERVGTVLRYFRRYQASLNYFRKALTTASLDKESPFPMEIHLARVGTLVQMGSHNQAKRLIDDVMEHTDGDLNARAELLIYRAKILSQTNATEAISSLDEASTISRRNSFLRTLADAQEALAEIYVRIGDYEKAEQPQMQSIQITQRRHGNSYLPERLGKLADIVKRRGRVSEARSLYDDFSKITEGILGRSASPYVRASLIHWMSDIYLNYFVLTLEHLKDPGQAFQVLERARGGTVAAGLLSKREEADKESPETKVRLKRISGLQARMRSARTEAERENLREQIFEAEQLMAPASTQDNEYFRRITAEPVSSRDLQSTLQEDEIILEFVLNNPDSYCLAITRDRIAAHRLPSRTQVDSLVDQFLFEVRNKQDARKIRKHLYSVLLGDIEGLDNFGRLHIVPDHSLYLLPFEPLIDQKEKMLLESHIVSYVQSATVLHLLRTIPSRTSNHSKMLLALGDAIYKFDPKTPVQRDSFPIEGFDLPRLQGTQREVLSIGQLFPEKGIVLTGKEATEDRLRSLRPLSQFRMFHFAVHAYSNINFPERSALVLTSKEDSSEDGLLQDREILDLPLSADLVTLSACDTGVGKLHGQEGMSSLVKAFMFAGAKTVVAGVWKVDDVFTSELMTSFYSRLATGAAKGTALRDAKLALIQKYKDLTPYFWAGFTLWGEDRLPIAPTN